MSDQPRPFEDIRLSVGAAIGKMKRTQLLDDLVALVGYVEGARAEAEAERKKHADADALLAAVREGRAVVVQDRPEGIGLYGAFGADGACSFVRVGLFDQHLPQLIAQVFKIARVARRLREAGAASSGS